jgi:hypothetical protein
MLAAGPGAFPCTVRLSRDKEHHSRLALRTSCRTWLHRDQIRSDQDQIVHGAKDTKGPTLGDTFLLPAPLRRIVRNDDRTLRVDAWTPALNHA